MRVASLILPEVRDLLRTEPAEIRELAEEIHPADLAEVIDQLDDELALVALKNLSAIHAARVIALLPLARQADLFERLGVAYGALVADEISPDDRADLFGRLSPDVASAVLAAMDVEEKTNLQRLLKYPPTSAGGLMSTEYVALPAETTVERAIDRIREVVPAIRTVHEAYAADERGALAGSVSLKDLVLAKPGTPLAQVMKAKPITVGPLTDQEEVARIISKYDLVALPVVDERRHVLGVVTVDDVVDVIKEEASEDIQKMGGMQALEEPYLQTGLSAMLRKRAGWLSALFLGELLTATTMGYFEHQLARALVLALFIPLIISSGGNSGGQASTLVIRAMALGEVRPGDWWRVVRRELATGLALGSVLGALGFLRVVVGQAAAHSYGEQYLPLAITVAVSLVGVVLLGTLAGSTLPLLLQRLGFDPASASAPFVATMVDVAGLVIYFTVASAILHGVLP